MTGRPRRDSFWAELSDFVATEHPLRVVSHWHSLLFPCTHDFVVRLLRQKPSAPRCLFNQGRDNSLVLFVVRLPWHCRPENINNMFLSPVLETFKSVRYGNPVSSKRPLVVAPCKLDGETCTDKLKTFSSLMCTLFTFVYNGLGAFYQYCFAIEFLNLRVLPWWIF